MKIELSFLKLLRGCLDENEMSIFRWDYPW